VEDESSTKKKSGSLFTTKFALPKVLLVGTEIHGTNSLSLTASLSELEGLAKTADYDPQVQITQKLSRIHPGHFLGKGKLDELKIAVEHHEIEAVIFDDALSPTQNRNLEKILCCRVLDRPALILEIFSRHARTRTAKTQVELAKLKYELPRLSKMWSHLSRQRGGIGMRDVGETQIQLDRRLIRGRITKLERKLKQLETEKKTQNKRREETYTVALVGYTNVGKSSLMNRLTAAGALAENKLFATLDATVRKIRHNYPYPILLVDTVGLIDKLPHDLVASFKSTLDEVRGADLLLKVVDLSHEHYREQMQVADSLLTELEADSIPSILIFNKVDAIDDLDIIREAEARYPGALCVSCKTGEGMERLKSEIDICYASEMISWRLELNYAQMKSMPEIRKRCIVVEEEYGPEGAILHLKLFPHSQNKLRELLHLELA
jgi:GTPase